MSIINESFHRLAEVRLDSKRRIALGKVQHPYDRYIAYENEEGQIILDPQIVIPASEAWLYKNQSALESVRKGLHDAKEGRVSKSDEDFSAYTNDSK